MEKNYSEREGKASYGRLAGTLWIVAVVGHHNPPENGASMIFAPVSRSFR